MAGLMAGAQLNMNNRAKPDQGTYIDLKNNNATGLGGNNLVGNSNMNISGFGHPNTHNGALVPVWPQNPLLNPVPNYQTNIPMSSNQFGTIGPAFPPFQNPYIPPANNSQQIMPYGNIGQNNNQNNNANSNNVGQIMNQLAQLLNRM